MNRFDTLTHLTMNTGHSRESPRSEVADDIVAMMMPLVKAGGGPLQIKPFTVRITRENGAAAFTMAHPEFGPVITCVLCMDAASATYAWAEAEKLYLRIIDDLARAGAVMTDSFQQLPPQPRTIPWLAVIMTGAAVAVPGDVMQWAGDFERCMAWAIIAAT